MTLRERFPDAFGCLKELFGQDAVLAKEDRVNEIYDVCELAWQSNLKYLDGNPIRYLLIAEAPPWSDAGQPVSYFYESLSGAWVDRVLKVFFERRPVTKEDVLTRLGREGFLLLDSLPFAMPYETRVRKSSKYLDLIKASKGYLLDKLCDDSITWSDDVKVALGFKWNGCRFIEVFRNGLPIPCNKHVVLAESQIAADGSGYTNPILLKRIWGIEGVEPCN